MSRRPDLRLASELYDSPHYASTNRQKVFQTLLADWLPEFQGNPLETTILTDNQGQATELNARCHELLKAKTTDGQPPPTLTTPAGVELVPGTKIRFERMLFGHKIAKGDLATVTRVSVDKRTVELLDNRLGKYRQMMVDDLENVRHAYANQLRDLQWLHRHRKQQEEQKPAFRYTEDDYVRRQQNYQEDLQPQATSHAWAYQAPPPMQPIPVVPQQQYACLGEAAMHMHKQHMQEIQAMQQRIEQQTQALSQQQHVQKNTWYESIQHYQQSQAQAN
jgi:hypothetical protein